MELYSDSKYIKRINFYTKLKHNIYISLIGILVININNFSKFIIPSIFLLLFLLCLFIKSLYKIDKNSQNINVIKTINMCITRLNNINVDYNFINSNTYIRIRYRDIVMEIKNAFDFFIDSEMCFDVINIYIKNILNNIYDFEIYYKKVTQNTSNSNLYTHHSINKYFSILEMKPTNNKKIIKKQYFKLLKKYHPDINPNGLEKTKKINVAYEKILECI